jgi:hypothetical protein
MTFQRDPGPLANLVMSAADKAPWIRFVIPFVRTTANLVKFAAERSPVGLIMPSVWKSLRAGGEARDLAVARLVVGSSIGAMTYQAARAGYITGGEPLDRPTADLLKDTGWQPYSVKVGDTYVSYRRFDPVSLIVSVAADLATYDKYMTPREKDRAAVTLTQLMSRNIQDSMWLSSLNDLLEMVDNPLEKVPGKVGQVAGTLLIPNLIAQPVASADKVERNQRPDPESAWYVQALQSMVNRVKARVPGLRETLPARLNAWGEEVPSAGRLGPDVVSPFTVRTAKSDPVVEELLRTGLRVGAVGKSVDKVTLTTQQRHDYGWLSGHYIRQDLADVVRSAEWVGASDDERRKWFDEIKRDARDDARADLRLGYDDDDEAAGRDEEP